MGNLLRQAPKQRQYVLLALRGGVSDVSHVFVGNVGIQLVDWRLEVRLKIRERSGTCQCCWGLFE